MKAIFTKRLLASTAIAALLASGIAVAQQPSPAPGMPAKPNNPAPPAAKSGDTPTASQSIDMLFKRIDTDADGALSKSELEKFDPEASKSFEKYDADKDAKLSLSEFDSMVKGLRGG